MQLIHVLEKHEHPVCEAQNTLHFDSHKVDCSVFHFKINNDTVEFSSTTFIAQTILIEEQTTLTKTLSHSTTIFYKALRAPPSILFLS